MPPSDIAVLLDLDETLVLSGALEQLRKQRNWVEVYARFAQTHVPSGTLKFISDIKNRGDIEIGVVTKSPRPYAEKLLRFHGIEVPVLVAYHDVSRHKPHPEALLKAAENLNVPACRCIYIGDHPDDMAAAASAKCIAIAITWTAGSNIPGTCKSWEAVYDQVVSTCERLNGKEL